MIQALTQYLQSKFHLRAKVMDVTSRLTRCAGQAADAISAYTQVKHGRRSIIVTKFQSHNVQIFRYVYQNTNGQNHGPAWKIQSFLLSEINLDGHPLAGPLWERKIRECSISTQLGTSSKLGMLVRSQKKKSILVCVCGRNKTFWKETKH